MRRSILRFHSRLLFAAVLPALVTGALALDGARYLIISHDSLCAAVQPLAQWKTQKGMLAKVVTLSETGNQPAEIQAYVRNAHSTWPVPPEYVLVVGAPSLLPASRLRTDDGYGDVSGDHQVELPVGRFFAETPAQCSTLVAKTLIYEKTPFAGGDSEWFLKGTTVINEDNPADAYYQPDCRYIRMLWGGSGYVETESLLDLWGDNSTDVRAAINDGRGFVVYRGQCIANWWPPFDQVNPATLTNGDKLPVIVSGSCETMTLDSGETMLADQFVRAGTAADPRGAVAYFGTTNAGAGVSLQRGTVTKGFFTAVFNEGRHKIGDAYVRGKFYLDSLVPGLQYFYEEWNLLGDPELPLWTETPSELAAEFDSMVPLDSSDFPVHVTRGGVPMHGALVCAMMDSTVYDWGETDNQGDVVFSINPVHPGVLLVTATARNCLPLEDSALVVVTGLAGDRREAPAVFSFECRPNPARGRLVVSYTLPQAGSASLTLYDVAGMSVKAIVGDGSAGTHSLVLDGAGLARGVYLVRLQTGAVRTERKVILQ